MIAIPALDLHGGTHVLRAPGLAGREVARLGDPLAATRELARLGFTRLHLTDLDAATGRPSNEAIVREVLTEWNGETQVGGAYATTDDVRSALEAGARYAIVDTRVVADHDGPAELASQFPGEVIANAVVRNRRLGVRRGNRVHERYVVDWAEEMAGVALAGLLVTVADRAGRAEGPDFALLEDVVESADCPVLAAGGIASLADLRALEERGLAGAVISTALHTGLLNAWLVAEEFAVGAEETR